MATFSDLTIGSAGSYTLQASATGRPAPSNPFTINPLPAPPVISNIATAPATTSVTVTWTTDVPATSCVAYGLTMALGSLSDNLTALTTSHSVTITGLSPLTPYYFSVISDNAFGQQSQSAVATWTTLADTAPPSTSFADGPADGATVCTSDTTFTWTGTDLVTPTAQLVYAYQLDDNAWSDFSAQTSLDLAGLPDGQHTLSVAARDAAGNVDPNPPLRHFTLDATPPAITQVQSAPRDGSAVITWTTDKPASSSVQYGADATYGNTATGSSTLVTAHSVPSTGCNRCRAIIAA